MSGSENDVRKQIKQHLHCLRMIEFYLRMKFEANVCTNTRKSKLVADQYECIDAEVHDESIANFDDEKIIDSQLDCGLFKLGFKFIFFPKNDIPETKTSGKYA